MRALFREIANVLGDEYPTSDEERDDECDDDQEEGEEEGDVAHACDEGEGPYGTEGEECQEEETMECDEPIDPEAPIAAPGKSPKPASEFDEPGDCRKKLTPKQQHDLIVPSTSAGPSGMQSKRDILQEKLAKIKALQEELGVGSYGCTS